MPTLFVVLGKLIAFALEGVDVHHHRMVDVLHFLESVNQRCYVIALGLINIVESHGAKQVVAASAIRLAQFSKVLV